MCNNDIKVIVYSILVLKIFVGINQKVGIISMIQSTQNLLTF